jgi:hypothetical protein
MAFFEDPVHETFDQWAIGFAPNGGADYGEVAAIVAQVAQVKRADDSSFFDACSSYAKRRIG